MECFVDLPGRPGYVKKKKKNPWIHVQNHRPGSKACSPLCYCSLFINHLEHQRQTYKGTFPGIYRNYINDSVGITKNRPQMKLLDFLIFLFFGSFNLAIKFSSQICTSVNVLGLTVNFPLLTMMVYYTPTGSHSFSLDVLPASLLLYFTHSFSIQAGCAVNTDVTSKPTTHLMSIIFILNKFSNQNNTINHPNRHIFNQNQIPGQIKIKLILIFR